MSNLGPSLHPVVDAIFSTSTSAVLTCLLFGVRAWKAERMTTKVSSSLVALTFAMIFILVVTDPATEWGIVVIALGFLAAFSWLVGPRIFDERETEDGRSETDARTP